MSQINSNNNSTSNLSDSNTSERVTTPQLNAQPIESSQNSSPYNINGNTSTQSLTSKLHQSLPKLNTNAGVFNPPPLLSGVGASINLSPTLNGQPTSRKSSFIGNGSPLNGLSNNPNGLISGITQLSLNTEDNEVFGFPVKIKNIPYDITQREACGMFSLASDFLGVDIYDDYLIATFSTASEATKVATILDGKTIFGLNYLPLKVETEELANSIKQGKQPITGNLVSPMLSAQSGYQQISLPKRHSSSATATGTRSRFVFTNGSEYNGPITENVASPIDLPTQTPTTANAGKSLIMMENQADANREYDQIVRGWSSSAANSNENGSQLINNMNSQPATPIGFDWSTQNSSVPAENANRRTSSSFFPGGAKTNQSVLVTQTNGNRPINKSTSPPNGITSLNVSTNLVPGNTGTNPNTPISATANGVDYGLLARLPLPSNPADQNPPCNTLYVGNLPPDATEAELRSLFSPQNGFRRLSFKTKAPNGNNGGHSHGPMCFVEFEDVGYATRALAELYGSQLPRPTGMQSHKGGIRLSFSKNPLGVRGPGQRRGSSNYNTNFQFNYNGQPNTPQSLISPQLPQTPQHVLSQSQSIPSQGQQQQQQQQPQVNGGNILMSGQSQLA